MHSKTAATASQNQSSKPSPLAGTRSFRIIALDMNAGTPSVLLVAAGCSICTVNAAGVGTSLSVQRDLTLIANPASPEKLLSAEQEDLRLRLAALDARIRAEDSEERREELRRERDSILARSNAVAQRLEETRARVAQLQLRVLEVDQRALLAKVALLDAQISAEKNDSRLNELRREREVVIAREREVRRAIEQTSVRLNR
jgi:hypothetical protein